MDAIYEHARAALYAVVDDAVIRDAAARPLLVRTAAGDRDEYLARRPRASGCGTKMPRAVASLYPLRRPQVQLVVSDGLNANARERAAARASCRACAGRWPQAGHHVGERDVVVRNGRVRAGYDIGGRTGADVVVHLIGERPGTGSEHALGLRHLRARRGRRLALEPRPADHSATTAVCGIHPRGKPPEVAVAEIARVVGRAVAQRRSGVGLESHA